MNNYVGKHCTGLIYISAHACICCKPLPCMLPPCTHTKQTTKNRCTGVSLMDEYNYSEPVKPIYVNHIRRQTRQPDIIVDC